MARPEPEFDKHGNVAITSDGGHIPPSYQWEETVDVSAEDEDGDDKTD